MSDNRKNLYFRGENY